MVYPCLIQLLLQLSLNGTELVCAREMIGTCFNLNKLLLLLLLLYVNTFTILITYNT